MKGWIDGWRMDGWMSDINTTQISNLGYITSGSAAFKVQKDGL